MRCYFGAVLSGCMLLGTLIGTDRDQMTEAGDTVSNDGAEIVVARL